MQCNPLLALLLQQVLLGQVGRFELQELVSFAIDLGAVAESKINLTIFKIAHLKCPLLPRRHTDGVFCALDHVGRLSALANLIFYARVYD